MNNQTSIVVWATRQSAILALTLLMNLNSAGSNVKSFFENTSGQEKSVDQSSNIKCTIAADSVRWRAEDKTPAISIEIEVHGTINTSVMLAVQLTALPRKEGIYEEAYWAPFSIATGRSTSDWQKLGLSAEKRTVSIRLVPAELLWAPTKSSVWPSDTMAKTVPPGEYSLQVQIEVNRGKTFLSNEVNITILREKESSTASQLSNLGRAAAFAIRLEIHANRLENRTDVCVGFGHGLAVDEKAVLTELKREKVKVHSNDWCNQGLRGLAISIISPANESSPDTYEVVVEVGDLRQMWRGGEHFATLLRRGTYSVKCKNGVEPELVRYQETCCPEAPRSTP
jgi:hypothetical protein